MPLRPAAQVAVAAPIDKTLSYLIPEELCGRLKVGHRVAVPLGRRLAVGYVFALTPMEPAGLREIRQLLDEQPLFAAADAVFYERAARYYAYPLGEAVRTALPGGLSGSGAPAILRERRFRPGPAAGTPAGSRQRELLAVVRAAGEATLAGLRDRFAAPHAALKRLVEQGFLLEEVVERRRDPFAAAPVAAARAVCLNAAQQQALAAIEAAIDCGGFAPFLLHGVTGSGKTEVYLRSIAAVLAKGRQALVLVPEIGLTPQLIARFRSWFQNRTVRLAVFHSGLGEGERYDAWRAAAAGEVDVLIGVRSAVFAPLNRLGLVIVDEEHDASYKQGEGFRYHARDLALLRGQMSEAAVLLGSATPSLGSYQRSREGQLPCLELPERVAGRPLPEVRLVDLAEYPDGGILSPPLLSALTATLAAGEQAMLLLNRRGYAPFLLCRDCGATCRCPNCAITLTYSRVQGVLRCHYCDYREAPPDTCPRCRGAAFLPEGAGTERLEEGLREAFPGARIARMDRDTTTRKGSHDRLLTAMADGAFDILIGTQMIAKGHDFAAVTLVGVVNADSALNLPDFRSAERVFALLSQAAGRAGRGARPGLVLIQSWSPDHYALEHAARHDYRGFAAVELAQRQALGYPPFGHLVNLVLSGNDGGQVTAAAAALAATLARQQPGAFELLGPAPCPLQKLRGRSRLQILLKAAERPPLRRLLGRLAGGGYRLPAGVALSVDVDPLDML